MLAAVRPDSWNLALLVHVAGAMLLVGGVVTAAAAGLLGWRDAGDRLLRFSSLTLFTVALPGWIIMRVGAEWIYSKEHWDDVPDDKQPTWLGIGFITADAGAILLLLALILGGVAVWRARKGHRGAPLLKASAVISAVLVAAYLVAVWAMGGKPS
jgi:ABC-type xylose transport system permease subunit